jgi:type IV pilus assembly protein PilC
MPRYAYEARDTAGQPCIGIVTADSEVEAARQVRAEGKYVTNLRVDTPARRRRAEGPGTLATLLSPRIKKDDVVWFANQLAVMVETGVLLSEALQSIARQTRNSAFRQVVQDVADNVESGHDLSAALARHPRLFDNLFVSMVRASEASGQLSLMLNRVATHMAEQSKIRKRVKGALMYPAVMLSLAFAVTLFLMLFVLPKFAAIYADKKETLPAATQFLMNVSDSMIELWFVYAGGLAAFVGLIVLLLKTDRGRRILEAIKFRVPMLGDVFRKAAITRSLRTLGTLLSGGVPVLDALAITQQVCGRGRYEQLWADVGERVRTGAQIGECLVDNPLMPDTVSAMLIAGEKGGRLGPTMERIAKFSEDELKTAITVMTSFVEPVMIGIMGIIVGGIAMALLLPIFSVSKVMTGH